MRRAAALLVLALGSGVRADPSAPGIGAREESGARAGLDYVLHCEGCHLVDGAGLPGAVPPLTGSVARIARLPGGREYLVRVPGVAQAALSDAALAALLDWVVVRFAEGAVPPGFAPYTEEEVARWRRRPLTDVAAARSALFAGASEPR